VRTRIEPHELKAEGGQEVGKLAPENGGVGRVNENRTWKRVGHQKIRLTQEKVEKKLTVADTASGALKTDRNNSSRGGVA